MLYGILHLSFWGYVIATLILTQITIAAVTIYLHRNQSHRALYLHPIVSHFFRFWLWLTTGMVTSEWVAIHRKHHASTEVDGDPHSPKLVGLRKVLLEGAELYRASTKDREMIEKYSHGTPDDWVERNVYKRYSAKGILLMFLVYRYSLIKIFERVIYIQNLILLMMAIVFRLPISQNLHLPIENIFLLGMILRFMIIYYDYFCKIGMQNRLSLQISILIFLCVRLIAGRS